jgi:glycosyltransferase involved in cell wall biosynthesis
MAISRQTVRPYEVIVVDNNSTDNTVGIANKFPFVTILHERRQGVVHARSKGFNAANGGIIGRIDADSRIDPDWVEATQKILSNEAFAAVTGSVRYEKISLAGVLSWADTALRIFLSRAMKPEVALQGANMAIRRSVWLQIRGGLCHQAGLHEDFDLSLHIARTSHLALFSPSLKSSIQLRQAGTGWFHFAQYFWACPMTYLRHNRLSGLYIVPFAALVILSYPILHLLHVSYSAERRKQFWGGASGVKRWRVNPATHVD